MTHSHDIEKSPGARLDGEKAHMSLLKHSLAKSKSKKVVSRIKIAALSLVIVLVVFYVICRLNDVNLLNGGIRSFSKCSSRKDRIARLHAREEISAVSTIQSKYFCIPEGNLLHNPTFANFADGWSRSDQNGASTVIKMVKWPDSSAAGILTTTPAQTGNIYQNFYTQEIDSELSADKEYVIRISFTSYVPVENQYDTPNIGVFLYGPTGQVVTDEFFYSFENYTTTTENFTVTPATTGKHRIAFFFQAETSYMYIHSVTIYSSSDNSCGSDIGYSVANTTSYVIPSMSDSFCVPTTNLLSNSQMTNFSSWTQIPGVDQFGLALWYDASAMGVQLPRSYNYTNPYSSSLSQIKPQKTFVSGQYMLEVVYSIYEVASAPLFAPVSGESNLNFTVSVKSETTITLLNWANMTLSPDITNRTNSFIGSVYLNADYDATVNILARSTTADIYIHTISLYEASDSSCSGSIIPQFSYDFPSFTTSPMSDALCSPAADYVKDPFFKNLKLWSITPAYESSLEQTTFVDGSPAGVVVNALTPAQFETGVTTTIGVKVDTPLWDKEYTLQIALTLVPRSSAPSIPKMTYYCHLKGNSTDTIWQGHVHTSMKYGENYVDNIPFTYNTTGIIDVRCHFAAQNADFYIFSYEVIVNEFWFSSPVLNSCYSETSEGLYKISGHTSNNILY
ncbi:hypothetical protein V1511DRAFT_504193 [Dipodascopsis uninucleata]